MAARTGPMPYGAQMMMNTRPVVETDEQYARRLQDEEMGIRRQELVTNNIRFEQRENPTVINQRMSEIYASRSTAFMVFFANIPQVIAAIVILGFHWMDADVCSPSYTNRWKIWSAVSAGRLLAYTIAIFYLYLNKARLEADPPSLANALNARNVLDVLGLVWFIVGVIWIFDSNSSADSCPNPSDSPIFNLCLAMILIFLVQICLPCVVTLILLPFILFCMPCLIRVIARIEDPQASRGANPTAINGLQLITINEEQLRSTTASNSTCPICINEMTLGEQARILPCKHFFHRSCVDEWLAVNATCPTCRSSIFPNASADPVSVADGTINPVVSTDAAGSSVINPSVSNSSR